MPDPLPPSVDRSHNRSGALLDVVPAGWGNTWEGRFLKQHYQLATSGFKRAGIELTDLHRVLLNRLGRVGLEVKRLELQLDRGELDEAGARRYHNLSTSYLHVLREIVLRPPRRVWSPERHELPGDDADAADSGPPPDMTSILAEMDSGA